MYPLRAKRQNLKSMRPKFSKLPIVYEDVFKSTNGFNHMEPTIFFTFIFIRPPYSCQPLPHLKNMNCSPSSFATNL